MMNISETWLIILTLQAIFAMFVVVPIGFFMIHKMESKSFDLCPKCFNSFTERCSILRQCEKKSVQKLKEYKERQIQCSK